MKFGLNRVENIVGKEKNAAFPPFSTMLSRTFPVTKMAGLAEQHFKQKTVFLNKISISLFPPSRDDVFVKMGEGRSSI